MIVDFLPASPVEDPLALEREITLIPGVVECGLFVGERMRRMTVLVGEWDERVFQSLLPFLRNNGSSRRASDPCSTTQIVAARDTPSGIVVSEL